MGQISLVGDPCVTSFKGRQCKVEPSCGPYWLVQLFWDISFHKLELYHRHSYNHSEKAIYSIQCDIAEQTLSIKLQHVTFLLRI